MPGGTQNMRENPIERKGWTEAEHMISLRGSVPCRLIYVLE